MRWTTMPRERAVSPEQKEMEHSLRTPFDSDQTQMTRYTFYDTAGEDLIGDPSAPESPERRRRRRKDRKDPYGAVLRKMLERARISAHHVDNLPREGKMDKLEMTRGAQTVYNKIAKRRPYNENYHWLPSLTEEEQLQKDIDTALNDKSCRLVTERAGAGRTPQEPNEARGLDRVKRNLPLRTLSIRRGAVALNPHWKKQDPSHGTNKYFNYDERWSKGKMNGSGRFCFWTATDEGEWRENNHGTGVATATGSRVQGQ